MTKIWMPTDSDAEFTEAQILNLDEFLERDIKLMNCEPLADRFPATTVEIQSDHAPDDYFNTGGMFVVSERLKAIFEEFEVHAEMLPLRVNYGNGEYTRDRFYFANILDEVDCFDSDKGACTFHQKSGFTDRIDVITKLAVDEKKAGLHHLFRMAKCSDDIVCASDSLATRILSLGLTGIRFVDPFDWDGC